MRQHLAVAEIQHHRGGALVASGSRLLQVGVDVISTSGPAALAAVQFADDAAERVHLQLHRAGAAAQVEVVDPLDPRAADAEAGQRRTAGRRPTSFSFGGAT